MCSHSELSQATSSDWETVCAECGEVMSEPKTNRGGSRPGAGRKPVSGVTRTSRTIDLTPLVWEFLTAGGNTAASEIEARIRATKAFRDWKKSQDK